MLKSAVTNSAHFIGAQPMRFFMLIFSIVFILTACEQESNKRNYKQVRIADTTVRAEISATPSEQIRGLQFVPSLGAHEAMLFIYEPPKVLTHWMREMQIPLDMIWIDQ